MEISPTKHVAAEVLEGLATAMDEETGALVERIRATVARELPSYAQVPEDEHRGATQATCSAAIAATVGGRSAHPDELDAARVLGARRAEQGVPVSELLQSFRIAYREGWATCIPIARRLGADSDGLLELSERLWSWTDELMLTAASAHREVELATWGEATRTRGALLRALLLGEAAEGVDPPAALARAGLRPGESLCCFAAESRSMSLPQVENALGRNLRRRSRVALAAVVDGVVAGVATTLPSPSAMALGAAGPVEVSRLPAAFADARRALRIGLALGREGLLTLEDLGLLAPIHDEDAIGRALVQRHLDPLRELPRGGADLVKSLQALLAHGLTIEPAARALFVHPNTLRHRLARIERTTGLRLDSMDDVVEVWWALRRGAADPETPGL